MELKDRKVGNKEGRVFRRSGTKSRTARNTKKLFEKKLSGTKREVRYIAM